MKCLRCNGSMRIKDYENPDFNQDGQMPCPECEGEQSK
jgi:hypothetical protein